jgi:hypothetical protein
MKNAVNLYITEIGAQIVVPDDVIKGVKFNKRHEADARYARSREYLVWCKRQEEAANAAWARGDDSIYRSPV